MGGGGSVCVWGASYVPVSPALRSRTARCGHWLTGNADLSSPLFFPSLPPSELPHAPQNLLASLNSSRSRAVRLSWVRPFDGNSPVLHYVVELSENSEWRAGRAGRAGTVI